MSETAFLDEPWLAALAGDLEGCDLGAPGLLGAVGVVVAASTGRSRARSAAAGSEASMVLDVAGGRVVAARPGPAPADALATLTTSTADARALLDGTVEPSVLYMQGRLKVAGDMRAVLAVLAATTTPGYGEARARVEGRTGG